jgi:NADH-quinone oxidoreductase subunit M
MSLLLLILVPVLGGALAFGADRFGPAAPRWVVLATLAVEALLLLPHAFQPALPENGIWLEQLRAAWIPRFGIGFHLGLDGVSLALTTLTVLLGFMAVAASWTEIRERVGAFHACLLWTLAGVVGVFLALDLFLFFVFWEVMIVPMYFLIALWGHEDRAYAAIKFFLFTQVSGLLMLLAVVVLAWLEHARTGAWSFDYFALLASNPDPDTALWLMLGFFVAFAVKLPAVPFHTWLPDAHTQAPTGGSVLLAGVLLKTGAYGLLRFVIPLFPSAATELSPTLMALGVVSIVYGGVMAFAQNDLKRLVAYSSISHMGFVLVGLFARNSLAMEGAVLTMVAHGISAAALFMLAGALQERLHTRDMDQMGGLWRVVPRMGALGLFFSVAALGLPGLGNFVGEFMVLAGAFRANPPLAILASLGLVVAPVYSLILIQRAFHGEQARFVSVPDLGVREMAAMACLILATVGLGLYPQPLVDLTEPSLSLHPGRMVAERSAP